MSEGKNKRLRKQTFVFFKPLTNEPSAIADRRARQRGARESSKPLTKVPPAIAGSGARQRVNLSELTNNTEVI